MVDVRKLQRKVKDRREPPLPNEVDKLLYNTVGEGLTTPVILKHVRGTRQVVHGQRALSKQVPHYLRRKTRDWDVIVTTEDKALKNADEIEDELDKIFGKDMFYVRVMSVGYGVLVFRVISRADRKNIVDYVAEKTPEHIVVDNVKYETLKRLRERAVKILSDRAFEFKWRKARDDIRRIDAALRFKKMKNGLIPW